ncbi:MAG: right-handed parallel beta-helix repeat-containing protein [Aureispira sp.]|nr:right-handed parallel beta-helix repeat-containing protein [Aureispira sp.]
MKTVFLFLASIFLFAACNSTQKLTKVENVGIEALSNIASNSYIKLKAKTYELEEHILIDNKENITIDGNGATLIMQSLSDDVVLITDSKNITLKNFKATHIEPQGPTGCTGNVLHIEGGADILVESCELNGSGIVGIAAYKTENLKVLKNHIHKNSEYGIIYQGPSIEIIGNTFENNSLGNLYFSYKSTAWPPEEKINSDQNKEGLKMSKNTFK